MINNYQSLALQCKSITAQHIDDAGVQPEQEYSRDQDNIDIPESTMEEDSEDSNRMKALGYEDDDIEMKKEATDSLAKAEAMFTAAMKTVNNMSSEELKKRYPWNSQSLLNPYYGLHNA
jgi:hypothetical protein